MPDLEMVHEPELLEPELTEQDLDTVVGGLSRVFDGALVIARLPMAPAAPEQP